MIRFYANKIVEDGIKDFFEFSNVIDIKEFGDYYIERCLFANPYISIRNLINQFVTEQTDNKEKREVISNIFFKTYKGIIHHFTHSKISGFLKNIIYFIKIKISK